jgi:hypothetical protein
MKLSDQELSAVLALVSPRGIDYQAGRICRLLAQGKNRTGILASKCSVGNLADVVLKHINPKIAHLGLFIACVKPPTVIKNKFGQNAGDFIYSFYRADKAANDDAIGSSPNDWEEELKPVLCNSVEG